MNLFVTLLFAHIVGDFFFQPKSMAVKKGASNSTALLHVAIYTFCVVLFTISYIDFSHSWQSLGQYYLWVAVVFIPHFIIDRWSLADKWLKLINGRTLEDFLYKGHLDIPTENKLFYTNYHILRGGFACIVYVVVDFTAHLMCLWYGFNLIFKV